MTLKIGLRRILLDSIDSTNNYAAEYAEKGKMADGTVIMAREQSAGRGQRGNSWQMQADRDLAMSILLRPISLTPTGAYLLNKAAALSVRRAIAENVKGVVNIKWPNDILIDGLKVSGILIEMSWLGKRCQRAVCGIGVNVSSERKVEDAGAISIKDANGNSTVDEMCASICHWASHYLDLSAVGREAEVTSEYRDHLAWRGEEHSYSVDGTVRRMQVVDVDDSGRLQVLENESTFAYPHGSIIKLPSQSL